MRLVDTTTPEELFNEVNEAIERVANAVMHTAISTATVAGRRDAWHNTTGHDVERIAELSKKVHQLSTLYRKLMNNEVEHMSALIEFNRINS